MRSSAMRISERTIVALMMGTALLATPVLAFDGAPISQPALAVQPAPAITAKKPVPPTTLPESAASSLSALQYAAEDGHPIAQWKLGRMYAEGNGVAQNDLLAFDYFSRIANAHGEDSPSAPQAQIVANAFVALGRYYLTGIPNSKITSDPERAREMFSYAASYFGNADAQYHLARLYLEVRARGYDVACGIMSARARTLVRVLGLQLEVLGPDRMYWGEPRAPVRYSVMINSTRLTTRWS